jgi:hypothetical protein
VSNECRTFISEVKGPGHKTDSLPGTSANVVNPYISPYLSKQYKSCVLQTGVSRHIPGKCNVIQPCMVTNYV